MLRPLRQPASLASPCITARRGRCALHRALSHRHPAAALGGGGRRLFPGKLPHAAGQDTPGSGDRFAPSPSRQPQHCRGCDFDGRVGGTRLDSASRPRPLSATNLANPQAVGQFVEHTRDSPPAGASHPQTGSRDS